MGLGAEICVTGDNGLRQCNIATTAIGYACASDSRIHFGLGGAKKIGKIEVKWPSGEKQILNDVAVDQILQIEERPPAP